MNKMTNWITLLGVIATLMVVLIALIPPTSQSIRIKKNEIRALKKVAIAATVLGQRKKLMIPLPVPLPLPIPIIHKHEPIISPIDPLLTLSAAKGAKGYYQGWGAFGGHHGGGTWRR